MGNLRERIAQSLIDARMFAHNNAVPIWTGLGTGAATYALTGLGKNKGKNRLLRAILAGVAGTGAGYGARKLQDYTDQQAAQRILAEMREEERMREGDEEDARIQAALADEFEMSSDPAQRYTNETLAQANKGQASTGTGNAGDPANLSYSAIMEQKENADKMQQEQYKNDNRERAAKAVFGLPKYLTNPDYYRGTIEKKSPDKMRYERFKGNWKWSIPLPDPTYRFLMGQKETANKPR